ncbi:MAG: Yip1 family protein [Methanoregula sp.]|nr:Yip1 family protein [Methanoregula sp.]
MSHSITELFLNPNAFFKDAMNRNESMKVPALIILGTGIVSAIYGYLIGSLSAKMMSGAMPGMDTIIILSSVLGALLGTFIFWVLWAGVMYGLSFLFKGQGSFRRTLEVVGYGYVPQCIGAIITLVAAFEYVPKITVPQITSAMLQDPVLLKQSMNTFMHDPAMVELTQITTLVSIVFLLWSANIWIFGMQHSRQLTMRDAALCVGIPVVLYILYMIYNLGVS